MDCSLKLITPPAIEPVTLDEVKLHARISHDVDNDTLEHWITTARMIAEDYQRRSYIGQMWEIAFDNYPPMPILIPRPPLIGIMSIKIYDIFNAETILYQAADDPITTTEESETEVITNSNFLIDTDGEPGRICLAYGISWPSTILRSMNSVKIRYAAGYGLDAEDVPAIIKDAIMLYCTYRNENRAAEVDEAPKQFYDLLTPNRMYT